MLASDLNNPEFIGAQNPDSLLQVEFYDFAAPDTWRTEETGVRAFRAECPFIRISVPGNQLSTVERPADERDTRRFPRQWLVYQMQTGKINNSLEHIGGTDIEAWGELDPETVRQLKYLRFMTVEQIAYANDSQINGIGIGGIAMREKAKAWISNKKANEAESAINERDAKIAALESKLDRLIAATEEKRGPGRPRNEERAAA